jgi:hypothetical protein
MEKSLDEHPKEREIQVDRENITNGTTEKLLTIRRRNLKQSNKSLRAGICGDLLIQDLGH